MAHAAPERFASRGPRLSSRPQPQQQQAPTRVREANAQYTEKQLQDAWDIFIAINSADHLLINTMRACRPKHRDGDTYTMTVESDIQAALVTENMPRILSHIHGSLDNTHVVINVVTNQGASDPITWNERECLADITRRHPSLADFTAALSLKLG